MSRLGHVGFRHSFPLRPMLHHPIFRFNAGPHLALHCAGLVSLVFSSFGCPTQAAATEQGWILVQKTGVTGSNTVYIGHDAIRVERQNADYVLLLTGPLWKAAFFNKKTKVIYQTDAEKIDGRATYGGLSMFCGARFSGLTEKDGGLSEKYGLKARRILLVSTHPVARMRADKAKRSLDGLLVRGGEYFVATDLPLPPAAAHAVQHYYSIPLAPGMPLLLRFTNEGGTIKNELDTIKCQREVLPPALFVPPRDYRQVTSERAVVMDSEKQDLLDELGQEPLRR
jgi:hypothetical protein